MKTLTGILFILLCFGCYPEKHEVIEIDGCEYIYKHRKPFSGEMAITHKGNCKNCRR